MITGKDKGRKGKILKILKKEGKVLVEGINLKKKNVKPKTSGKKGETVEMASPVDISNLKVICPKCGKPVRVGIKKENNKKSRFCKSCKQEI